MKQPLIKNNWKKLIAIVAVISIVFSGAGCVGFQFEGNGQHDDTPATNSPTNTEFTHTDTSTPTKTESSTQTPSPTPPSEVNKTVKYRYFTEGYIKTLNKSNVNVVNYTIKSNQSEVDIVYRMEDPDNNATTGSERENITVVYGMAVEYFISDEYPDLNKSWIPKRLNVTATTPAGDRYETAYTTYDLAMKWINGEISKDEFVLRYYSTIELGPANPASNR